MGTLAGGWGWGLGASPQLCLSVLGLVALGRRPILSDLHPPICT